MQTINQSTHDLQVSRREDKLNYLVAEAEGRNDFLNHLLFPMAQGVVPIPDLRQSKTAGKCVSLDQTISGTDFILVYRPRVREAPFLLGRSVIHPLTGNNCIGVTQVFGYDDAMSTNWRTQRTVSAGFFLKSEGIPIGNFALTGRFNATPMFARFDFDNFNVDKMAQYNPVESIQGGQLTDGVVGILPPISDSPFEPTDPSFFVPSKLGSLLQKYSFIQGNPLPLWYVTPVVGVTSTLAQIDKSTDPNFLSITGSISLNVNWSFSSPVIALTTQTSIFAEFFYVNSSGVLAAVPDIVVGGATQNVSMPNPVAGGLNNCVLVTTVRTSYPVAQIRLRRQNIGIGTENYGTYALNIEVTNNSYYENTAHSQQLVVQLEGGAANQTYGLTAYHNYEVEPKQSFLTDVNYFTNALDTYDDFTDALKACKHDPNIRMVYTGTDYVSVKPYFAQLVMRRNLKNALHALDMGQVWSWGKSFLGHARNVARATESLWGPAIDARFPGSSNILRSLIAQDKDNSSELTVGLATATSRPSTSGSQTDDDCTVERIEISLADVLCDTNKFRLSPQHNTLLAMDRAISPTSGNRRSEAKSEQSVPPYIAYVFSTVLPSQLDSLLDEYTALRRTPNTRGPPMARALALSETDHHFANWVSERIFSLSSGELVYEIGEFSQNPQAAMAEPHFNLKVESVVDPSLLKCLIYYGWGEPAAEQEFIRVPTELYQKLSHVFATRASIKPRFKTGKQLYAADQEETLEDLIAKVRELKSINLRLKQELESIRQMRNDRPVHTQTPLRAMDDEKNPSMQSQMDEMRAMMKMLVQQNLDLQAQVVTLKKEKPPKKEKGEKRDIMLIGAIRKPMSLETIAASAIAFLTNPRLISWKVAGVSYQFFPTLEQEDDGEYVAKEENICGLYMTKTEVDYTTSIKKTVLYREVGEYDGLKVYADARFINNTPFLMIGGSSDRIKAKMGPQVFFTLDIPGMDDEEAVTRQINDTSYALALVALLNGLPNGYLMSGSYKDDKMVEPGGIKAKLSMGSSVPTVFYVPHHDTNHGVPYVASLLSDALSLPLEKAPKIPGAIGISSPGEMYTLPVYFNAVYVSVVAEKKGVDVAGAVKDKQLVQVKKVVMVGSGGDWDAARGFEPGRDGLTRATPGELLADIKQFLNDRGIDVLPEPAELKRSLLVLQQNDKKAKPLQIGYAIAKLLNRKVFDTKLNRGTLIDDTVATIFGIYNGIPIFAGWAQNGYPEDGLITGEKRRAKKTVLRVDEDYDEKESRAIRDPFEDEGFGDPNEDEIRMYEAGKSKVSGRGKSRGSSRPVSNRPRTRDTPMEELL